MSMRSALVPGYDSAAKDAVEDFSSQGRKQLNGQAGRSYFHNWRPFRLARSVCYAENALRSVFLTKKRTCN